MKRITENNFFVFLFCLAFIFSSCSKKPEVEKIIEPPKTTKLVELDILIQDENDKENISKIILAYKKLKQNVNINIIYSENFYEEFNKLITNDNLPDLILYKPYNVYYRELLTKGYLHDLNDENLKIEFDENIKSALNTSFGSYVFPLTGDVFGLIINKGLFVTYNIEEPTNWESFINASESIKNIGKNAFQFYASPGDKFSRMTLNFLSIISMDGIETFLKDLKLNGSDSKNSVFNDYYILINQIFSHMDLKTVNYDYEQSYNEFASGRAFMTFGNSRDLLNILKIKKDLDLKLIQMPNPQNNSIFPIEIKSGISIVQQSNNKEEAAQFINFFKNYEVIDFYTNKNLSISLVSTAPSIIEPFSEINKKIFVSNVFIDDSGFITNEIKSKINSYLYDFFNNKDIKILSENLFNTKLE